MKISDYIRFSKYTDFDKRHCHNMQSIFNAVDELRPMDKAINKVANVSDGYVTYYGDNRMFFEFTLGRRRYVLDYDNGICTLQENHDSGDIDYLIDKATLLKCLNRLKKQIT